MKQMKHTMTKKRGAVASLTELELCQLAATQKLTIGIDIGDQSSRYCVLDQAGEVVSEGKLPTTKAGFELFTKMAEARIAIEVGTHSLWISHHLKKMGHDVIVANPRKVRLISDGARKNDRIDARHLARLARVDPELLFPIQHRGEAAQTELQVIRARAELMTVRTAMINSARGLVKPLGERLQLCDADQVGVTTADHLSEAARAMLKPMLEAIENVSARIQEYDAKIDEIEDSHPEVKLLKQVYGVGTMIALTFVLTIEEPGRFAHSRDVGPYLGLTPKQHESGESQPECRITKNGDKLLRSLLVQGAHCILRKNAPDSDLRKWGLEKAGTGSKKTKKRAVVAVARRLAVLLHHLWVTGEVYDPQYNRKAAELAAAKAKNKAAAGKQVTMAA